MWGEPGRSWGRTNCDQIYHLKRIFSIKKKSPLTKLPGIDTISKNFFRKCMDFILCIYLYYFLPGTKPKAMKPNNPRPTRYALIIH